MRSKYLSRKPWAALPLFIIITLVSQAQQLDLEKLEGLKPRSIGPAGMSGRVTAIDAVNDQPEIIYVGTASGGLWKSESGGIAWEPVFDDVNTMSIGAVAIQQSNPDVVWAGTGEGNPRNSLNGGYGIYKSLDAGKTWKLMGLEKTRHIHRVVINPQNPDEVYVAAIGSPWGEHKERGVYKTSDGGKSWEKILYVNQKTGAADLVMDPNNPDKLFAAMWEHRRKPWTFTSGGPGSGFYVTVDGGENWKELTSEDGLPEGDLGRIGIAVSQSNPKRVYALIESKKNALYRSDDGGYKWKKINDNSDQIGNRPFYYSEIYVDPANDNRIYTIFTYVNVSEDGGKSFTQLMDAYGTSNGVHPDHHAWWINPKDPDFMIDGNDGGLNITHDRGKTWRFVENLPLAQFYHINVDNEYPYNVYGGMQDNGSWVGPAYVWRSQGIRNSYWQELSFGDGFDVIPDSDDSRYGFSMAQQGYVVRYDKQTGHQRFIQPTHPDADVNLRFNWNAAIAQDPFDNSTIYFGSQFVHKSTDKGSTWEVISPDLTTNDPEKQKQHESGGLTMDATGAENNTTILAISPSILKKDLIWVGTDDGLVQLTRDGGESWSNLAGSISGMPQAGWVAQVKPSTFKPEEAFVVVNNYRNFDYKPYLFHTRDYGKTWKNLVSEDQVWNYVLSFVQDPIESNLMFLGSEGGLYVSIDGGSSWTHWTNDFPKVPVMDLVIHPREHDLVIGTYGRAAYVMDDIRPLRALAKEGKNVLDAKLKVFEAPEAYITLNQEPSGTRFAADAIYSGKNRPGGAMISYLINRPEKKEKETADKSEANKKKGKKETEELKPETPADSSAIKYDSVKLEIFNEGKLIRTISNKAPEEDGFHRMYWGLEEGGVFGPGRSLPEENAQEPGGLTVLPGIYKARISIGDQADSTMINVRYDPRVEMKLETLQAKRELRNELQQFTEIAGMATKRLLESKKIAEEYMKKMKEEDEKGLKEEIELSKAMTDSVNVLLEPFIGKDYSKEQGIIRSPEPDIRQRINTAGYYILSSLEAPGDTEKRLVEQAKDKLYDALKEVNAFFDEEWKDYQSKMEEVKLNPFKSYEPFETK